MSKPGYYFLPSGPQLRVFKDRKAMHRGFERFKIEVGRQDMPDSVTEDAQAMVSSGSKWNEYAFHYPNYCCIFLNEEELGAGIVAHECLHAALRLDAFERFKEVVRTYETIEAEERLCYLLGDIVRDVWNALYSGNHVHKEETE
jgi:hypothetical protein